MKKHTILLFAFLLSIATFAQECYPIDKNQIKSIKTDVEFLSSDALEGRSPGTNGEIIARDYISKRFQQLGIIPMGNEGYSQIFEIDDEVHVNKNKTVLVIKKDTLLLNTDFYPLVYSSNGNVAGKTVWLNYGISAPELNHDDYKKVKSLEGKIAVIDVSSPDGIHPHSEYAKYHDLSGRLEMAKSKGAIGAILVNLGNMANDPENRFKKIRSVNMPVVFVSDKAHAKSLKKSKEVALAVKLAERTLEAYNVVGFVDNGKESTVVIGAHYDHLGYGDAGSLYVGEPAIHNGADDNASGTAALLALAEFVSKKTELTGHNYLFIAFTAEEKGLLGSNYYVNNPTYPMEKVAYMINMDMVGRLRENQLQISGTGTSESWSNIEAFLACDDIILKLDPSGIGPSDHASFYNMRKPVLHFFTGSHSDYHKPTDDADLINYKGIATVVSLIKTTMAHVDKDTYLEFIETPNDNAKNAPKFSVTLGIMPDYMYQDGGVKIDGVTPEKPAANAGLQKGDIVVQLGDFKIEDIYAYMGALAAFKKGDKVAVAFIRNGEHKESEIQF